MSIVSTMRQDTMVVATLSLVSMTLLQTYGLSPKIDLCKANGFPGPHETWQKFTGFNQIYMWNLNRKYFPKYPDHVYYELSCDPSNWLGDFTSKYLIDADPLGADNWSCGSYRQTVVWACNTTNGSWTSWRNINQFTSDYSSCGYYYDVAKEDIPLRDECCTPWSDYTPAVKQPNHCIATCLWYPLRDPENGFRMWDIKRHPYTFAPQGAEVLYVCNDGYHIVGDPHVRCTSNSNWTSIPVCEEDEFLMKRFAPLFTLLTWVIVSVTTISMAVAYINRVQHCRCRQHI